MTTPSIESNKPAVQQSVTRSDISPDEVKANIWSIRPCYLYKEEYDECKSIKSRFHQYFIHGESVDCLQWKRDYDSCTKFERNTGDVQSAKEVIDSEIDRRAKRMQAHYQNNVWRKRQSPPSDWEKTLPDWLVEKNQNTYLELKANEMAERGAVNSAKENRTMCSVM